MQETGLPSCLIDYLRKDNKMSLSPITKEQWIKVGKAAAYSFVSALATFVLVSSADFSKKTIVAGIVAGVNAAFVTVKQAFTEAK